MTDFGPSRLGSRHTSLTGRLRSAAARRRPRAAGKGGGAPRPVRGGPFFPSPGRPGYRFTLMPILASGAVRSLVFLLLMSLSACGASREPMVVVFASPDSPRLRQTVAALTAALAPRRLEVAIVPALGEEGPEALRRLRATQPALFVVLGTPALAMLAKVERRTPAVFALVANPYFSDAAWDPNRPEFHLYNVTGLASPPPVLQALQQATALFGPRSWGLLYDPLDGSALEIARTFQTAAAGLGLTCMVEASSDAAQDQEALERLLARGSQVLYVPPTATAARYAPLLLAAGRERRALVVNGHPEVAPQGAILSLTLDYHALGTEAAALARRLLAKESPAHLPIQEAQPLLIQVDDSLVRYWSGYPAPRK